jgi:PAS domain S-box-containing protein
MKKTLGGGMLIAIGLVVALLLVNAALTLRNTQQLDRDARWVAQTHELLDLTGDVLLTLIDAETGQRGFLVTGREDFLGPYHAALARREDRMAALKDKAKDNPRLLELIKQLDAMSVAEMALLKQGIDMRRHKAGREALLDIASKGQLQMSAVRAAVAEIRKEEQELLVVRQRQTAEAYHFALWTELITTAVGLCGVGAFVWALKRTLRTRQQAAAVLQQQREWLQMTLTSIGDAVIATDADGRITLLNAVAETLTGWRFDEARGQPLQAVFNIVHEQTRQAVENPVGRVLQSRAVVGLANHTLLIARDGTQRPIDDSAAPIKNNQGEITGVVLVFRDLTERRHADEAIRQGQLRLRMALAAARMVVWEWKPPLNKVITSVSSADVFGLPAGSNIEDMDKLFALIHPEDVQRHRALVKGAVERCESYVSQYRIIRPDNGALSWLEERGYAMASAPGKIERLVVVVMDINERKRAEEALKDADHKKNEFLAILAHELRNPLAPICNALHIMRLAGSSGSSSQSFAAIHAMMERQVGQLVRLVDDLLDVNRITLGKLELRKARIAVAQVVDIALETTRPAMEAAHHELTISLPPRPLQVDGDLTRLAQVVSNLLSNSARYTPHRGHVWLTVEQQAEAVVIGVRDDGMGISPDMLPVVFDMFTQVEKKVARATVEAHSAGLGKGSEFIVRLPLAMDAAASPPTVAVKDGPAELVKTSGRRILVVDDNADSAESLGMLLRILGNEVRTAHDGPSALEEAKKNRPEVVLLDIGMPGMSGYEVARRMRLLPELQNAILVAQTGWGQEEDRRQSTDAGFNAHLVKPVDQTALKNLLAGLKS